MVFDGSGLTAWAATALFPSTALAGWILRRFVSGAFVVRLRPHFVFGYAVFGSALIHSALAMGRMGSLSAADSWFAFFAIVGLGLQVFVGASLQAPGAYRAALRRWHLALTCAVALSIGGHVALTLL